MSNAAHSNRRRLLNALGDVPPNTVYSIAPKPYIIRGFDYYRDDRVLGFRWNRDSSSVKAIVHGGRNYSVEFSLNDEGIEYSCDCPAWDPYSNCKHIVCVLMTIKNLFDPSSFRGPLRDEKHRRRLYKSLFHRNGMKGVEEAGKDKYEVVFQIEGREPDIYVRKNNEKLVARFYGEPEELAPLILPSYFNFSIKLSKAKRLLGNCGNRYPLILKSDGKETAVEYEDSADYSCMTEFDAYNRYVKVTRLLKKNGRRFSRFILVEDMVIDLEDGKIRFLKDRSGWAAWYELKNMSEPSAVFENDITGDHGGDETEHRKMSIKIPLGEFNKIRIVYPAKYLRNNVILKRGGKPATLRRTPHDHRLIISDSNKRDDVLIIKAESRVSGLSQTPSNNVFDFFVTLNHGLRGPLKAKKRRAKLCATFFDMLSAGTKKAANVIIKDTLSGDDFKEMKIRREARSLLREHLAAFFRTENQFQLRNGEWVISSVDKRRELLLYRIPYELFGRGIFNDMSRHDEMPVPSKDLLEKLPALYEKCAEHGIKLFFKKKPVVWSKWEFAFDASRSTDIDWFEIRPEIRCDGRAMDESEWIEILTGKRTREDGECVRIMDPDSHKILNRISAILRTRDAGDRDSKRTEIVHVPRLSILDWMDLRRNGVRIKLPPEDERIIERLQQFEKIERRPLPKKLKARLRPYQKEGYYWLSFLYEHRFGACLADDMGLGKTVQAIAMLGGIGEGLIDSPKAFRSRPHLIVVPPSLLFNWENEIKKFYPALKVYQYTGKDRATGFKGYDIVLTTYALVRRDIEKLEALKFNVIVFDEAQAIKNIFANTTGAVRRLQACFKLAMTGTPLENHLGEYYSIIDLILPGLLGEYDIFKPLLKRGTAPELDVIIKRTRPFVLRRTKEKILKDLPQKMETDIYLELTEKQKLLYQKTVERVRTTIDEAYKNKTASQAKIIALTAILKLRQICITPRLLSDEIDDGSPKIDFLIGKLKELHEEDHGALVFSQFTSFLDLLEEYLEKNGLKFLRLDGSTPSGKRKKIVERFQSGDGPSIFLLSLRAGGQGLNLTRASYVFHLDPWWNPAVENQASDRAHRIGQSSKVHVMRILTRHTIEEKMMHLKKKKLALYRAVMGEMRGGKAGISITKSDFDFLLR